MLNRQSARSNSEQIKNHFLYTHFVAVVTQEDIYDEEIGTDDPFAQ